MNKRFSELNDQELNKQITDFEAELKELKNSDNESRKAVVEQKLLVARSYKLNRSNFKTGRLYYLEDTDTHIFKLNYINGVFAWGSKIQIGTKRENREEALPLALLKSEVAK